MDRNNLKLPEKNKTLNMKSYGMMVKCLTIGPLKQF